MSPPFSCFGGLLLFYLLTVEKQTDSGDTGKMADHAAGDDIFVYTGGRAPQHVVNAIIDESVEEIDDGAFRNNPNLKSVVCHDGY